MSLRTTTPVPTPRPDNGFLRGVLGVSKIDPPRRSSIPDSLRLKDEDGLHMQIDQNGDTAPGDDPALSKAMTVVDANAVRRAILRSAADVYADTGDPYKAFQAARAKGEEVYHRALAHHPNDPSLHAPLQQIIAYGEQSVQAALYRPVSAEVRGTIPWRRRRSWRTGAVDIRPRLRVAVAVGAILCVAVIAVSILLSYPIGFVIAGLLALTLLVLNRVANRWFPTPYDALVRQAAVELKRRGVGSGARIGDSW